MSVFTDIFSSISSGITYSPEVGLTLVPGSNDFGGGIIVKGFVEALIGELSSTAFPLPNNPEGSINSFGFSFNYPSGDFAGPYLGGLVINHDNGQAEHPSTIVKLNIGNGLYVFDLIKETPISPVAASNYSSFGVDGALDPKVQECYNYLNDNLGVAIPVSLTVVAPTLGTIAFHAATFDPVTYESLPQAVGVGTPTFAVDDGLLLPDHEGIYRTTAEDTAPWHGARKVTNFVRASSDFENAAWTSSLTPRDVALTTGVAGPSASLPATTITATAANGQIFDRPDGLNEGDSAVVSFWMRRRTGSGNVTVYTGSNGQTTVTGLTASWQRFAYTQTILASTDRRIGLRVTTLGDAVDVCGFQCEVVNGQSNQNPSEYVPTSGTSASAYFANENGNTVSGNVVTEAVGTPLAEVPALYSAPALTNLLPHSNDLTDAAWNVTGSAATFDQVGLTGEPNTASLFTSTGNNAQKIYPITLPTTLTDYTLVLRAKATPNTVNMALQSNGFDTGTATYRIQPDGTVVSNIATEAVAHDIDGDYVTLYMQITAGSTLSGNAIVKFEVGNTSGQDFIVLNVELYEGTISEVRGCAPIITSGTTVSVAATNSIQFDPANHDDYTLGIWYVEAGYLNNFIKVGSNRKVGLIGNNVGGMLYVREVPVGAGITLRSYDGSTDLVAGVATPTTPGEWKKCGVVYSAAEAARYLSYSGATAEGAYDGTADNTSTLQAILYTECPILIRNIRRYEIADYQEGKDTIDGLMI